MQIISSNVQVVELGRSCIGLLTKWAIVGLQSMLKSRSTRMYIQVKVFGSASSIIAGLSKLESLSLLYTNKFVVSYASLLSCLYYIPWRRPVYSFYVAICMYSKRQQNL